eukprot:SAG25_NODE_9_length_28981_cov_95.245274_23_plen_40_part_00
MHGADGVDFQGGSRYVDRGDACSRTVDGWSTHGPSIMWR